MKKCETSLVIRQMQIKTMQKFHFTSGRMAVIKETANNICLLIHCAIMFGVTFFEFFICSRCSSSVQSVAPFCRLSSLGWFFPLQCEKLIFLLDCSCRAGGQIRVSGALTQNYISSPQVKKMKETISLNKSFICEKKTMRKRSKS